MQKRSWLLVLRSRWMSLRPELRFSLFIAIKVAIGGLLAWLSGVSPRAVVSSFLIISVLTATGFAATMVLQRIRR